MEKMTKPANMLVQELMQQTMMESLKGRRDREVRGGGALRCGGLLTTGWWNQRAVTSEGREEGSRRETTRSGGPRRAISEQDRKGRVGRKEPPKRTRRDLICKEPGQV